MAEHCSPHQTHEHLHGPRCGHLRVQWEDKSGYLHDGHLHSEHGGHWDETAIPITQANPDRCEQIACAAEVEHYPEVPHGDHRDHVVKGRLHRRHRDHCDDHGPVRVAE